MSEGRAFAGRDSAQGRPGTEPLAGYIKVGLAILGQPRSSKELDPTHRRETKFKGKSNSSPAILDGVGWRGQVRRMKTMMLILLGVRMLFLVFACFGCVFAIISGLRPGVEWYWPTGGALGLGMCGFLIGRVWASLKATWKS